MKRACKRFNTHGSHHKRVPSNTIKKLKFYEMKRACKNTYTQGDDYGRDTYDTFENKQL